MNLGVDPKHADQLVRGVCNLPNGSGRTARVAVFARGAKAEEAKAAGADVVGAEDLVEQVSKGTINFDRCIATPDMMGLVGRLGKVLGPRGLMPNPRVGTVTMDVINAVKGAKGGSVEFRVEKAGIVHAGVGKASFTEKALAENIKAFVDAVVKAKPPGAKGTYVKKVSISSTMGPGVKIDAAGLNGGAGPRLRGPTAEFGAPLRKRAAAMIRKMRPLRLAFRRLSETVGAVTVFRDAGRLKPRIEGPHETGDEPGFDRSRKERRAGLNLGSAPCRFIERAVGQTKRRLKRVSRRRRQGATRGAASARRIRKLE